MSTNFLDSLKSNTDICKLIYSKFNAKFQIKTIFYSNYILNDLVSNLSDFSQAAKLMGVRLLHERASEILFAQPFHLY